MFLSLSHAIYLGKSASFCHTLADKDAKSKLYKSGVFVGSTTQNANKCHKKNTRRAKTLIQASRSDDSSRSEPNKHVKILGSAALAAIMALEIISPVAVTLMAQPPPAQAVLSAPNAKIPRSVDAALRRSVPLVNSTTKEIQRLIEDVAFLLRIPQRKPYGNMTVDVEKCLQLVRGDRIALLASAPPGTADRLAELLDELEAKLIKLTVAIETKDPDRVGFRVAAVLSVISDVAKLQAPGLPYLLPPQYRNLPSLTGRATVEFKLKKANQSDREYVSKLGGGGTKTATIRVELDGYSAPLTAGHFVKLVQEGYYKNAAVNKGDVSLFVGGEGSGQSNTPTSTKQLPLEVLEQGAFEPRYRSGLDILDGELPVLPMSVFGSVAMARGPENESDPSKFFFYLFDKRQSGLGGMSFEEGSFSVFGYVTEGSEILTQIEKGDIVTDATVIAGSEKLNDPSAE